MIELIWVIWVVGLGEGFAVVGVVIEVPYIWIVGLIGLAGLSVEFTGPVCIKEGLTGLGGLVLKTHNIFGLIKLKYILSKLLFSNIAAFNFDFASLSFLVFFFWVLFVVARLFVSTGGRLKTHWLKKLVIFAVVFTNGIVCLRSSFRNFKATETQ